MKFPLKRHDANLTAEHVSDLNGKGSGAGTKRYTHMPYDLDASTMKRRPIINVPPRPIGPPSMTKRLPVVEREAFTVTLVSRFPLKRLDACLTETVNYYLRT